MSRAPLKTWYSLSEAGPDTVPGPLPGDSLVVTRYPSFPQSRPALCCHRTSHQGPKIHGAFTPPPRGPQSTHLIEPKADSRDIFPKKTPRNSNRSRC